MKKRIKQIFNIIEDNINKQKLLSFNKIKNHLLNFPEKKEQENNIQSIYLIGKINSNLCKILQIYTKSNFFIKQKSFNKWRKINFNIRETENQNGEIENKIKMKYDQKLKEYENKIQICENEFNELKINLQNLENKQKKLNESLIYLKEKEEKYVEQNKIIQEEKKICQDKLKDLKSEITIKCAKIENYIRELDNVLLTEKENTKDKEAFVNNYIAEMNTLLDYYEQKSGIFI